MTAGNDSNLYGTAYEGGLHDSGTVFRISLSGTLTTLVSLNSATTGSGPTGRLILAADGNLYGTAASGGPDQGTVFKV
ncbi:choice-of-anchor tandem repeat GloVer-containing protein, partial [Acinetobacter baumannii]